MFLHVFFTWVFANLLFPSIVAVWPFFNGEEVNELLLTLTLYYAYGMFLTLAWSFPLLLLGRFFIIPAVRLKGDMLSKFLIWLLLITMAALVNGVLLGLIERKALGKDDIFIITGQMVLCLWIASIVRYGYFVKLVKQYSERGLS